MRAYCKIAAASATLAVALAFGNAATAASAGGPDDAYCLSGLEDGSSPWCGYATFEQCQETASGTGGDCVANVWRDRGPIYGIHQHRR